MAKTPSFKLLVVDDDAGVRKSVSGLLTSKFGAPLQADNGLDAITMVREQRPKLMLLDVSMPKMSGIEVLRAALAIDPDLIVIMLTSGPGIETAELCLSLGAKQYITKPFEIEDLRREIEHLLAHAGKHENGRPWKIKP